jgi:phosphatidate cytidylyltransferase
MKIPANLKKRAVTSIILIATMLGILFGDDYLSPRGWPFLCSCVFILQAIALGELMSLLQPPKPNILITFCGLFCVYSWTWEFRHDFALEPPTKLLFSGYLVIALVILAIEICRYNEKEDNTRRVTNTLLALFYLGTASVFLLLIRFLPTHSTLALAATIFVPKIGDVGAYLTGSLIGKHKMTPTLSPKKTWEGFAGGMLISILVAIAFNFIGPEPLFKNGVPEAIAFGFTVGLAGVFGDLFASMIKRDAQVKDASQSIPGFGGVLDVVDSVLFAAPVAYLFFVW